jgi:tRNA threonylcarbamoyl adenosine modification protein YeaZ
MILAFNTSLADLHIGLFSETAELLAEFHHIATDDERHIHDMLLAQSVAGLLDKIPASAKDISRITFINGPGSFTGLRIGLSFAKGMAFGSENISLVPLIAHSVLLKTYLKSRTTNHESRLAILYPGYSKDSVYLSFSNEPEKVEYIQISELLKMNIEEVICSPELNDISIPHHTVSISLQTMAEMAIAGSRSSLAELEPFYGTDFKPGKQ